MWRGGIFLSTFQAYPSFFSLSRLFCLLFEWISSSSFFHPPLNLHLLASSSLRISSPLGSQLVESATMSLIPPTMTLYPLSNYTFGSKDSQPEEDPSVPARMQRLKDEFEVIGMRKTVEGVLLVHQHNHPHILTLQIGNSFFKLPGDTLRPGEDEIEGLSTRLSTRLAPVGYPAPDWDVRDMLSCWWRPNFENQLVCPPSSYFFLLSALLPEISLFLFLFLFLFLRFS